MAGSYALARKEVGEALPGVAIAAALMPPLGVVGLGLSLGKPQVVGGAFLLFVTNIAAISLAGVLVFLVLGVRPQTWRAETRQRMQRSLIGFALLLLVVAIPLATIMGSVVRDTARQQVIQEILEEQMNTPGQELVNVEYQKEGNALNVIATVRSSHPPDPALVDSAAMVLQNKLNRPISMELVTLPVIRSEE
jgi:uncharacterized membrane protein